MQLKSIAAVLIACILCAGAQAADREEYTPYVVAGVLQKNGTTSTIRVVQAMVVSNSAANAQSIFTLMALKQFPDHVPVQVLASTLSQLYKTLPDPAAGQSNGVVVTPNL